MTSPTTPSSSEDEKIKIYDLIKDFRDKQVEVNSEQVEVNKNLNEVLIEVLKGIQDHEKRLRVLEEEWERQRNIDNHVS